MSEPKCAIVVANKYPDLWDKFCEKLNAVPAGMEYTLIRVDGNKENFTYSKAMNEGLEQVEDQFVCFMNDDAYPMTDNWLLRLCQILSTGFVGVSPIEMLNHEMNPSIGKPPVFVVRHDPTKVKSTTTLNGFCLVSHTGLIKQIGGWDESFTHYYEDNDLSIRLEDYGWNCYASQVKVWHAQKTSTDRAKDRNTEGLIEQSKDRFLEKWGTAQEELK